MANTQPLGSIWKGRAWDDGEPVPRVTLPDGTKAEAVAAMGYAWNGTLWTKILSDSAGNLTTGHGKTLLFGSIAQGAAGTTSLVGAQGGSLRAKLVSYVIVLSATGTAKFTDGAGDLTGAMDIAINGGAVVVGDPNSPLLQTTTNSALSLVTTVGAARGHFTYIVEA